MEGLEARQVGGQREAISEACVFRSEPFPCFFLSPRRFHAKVLLVAWILLSRQIIPRSSDN